MKIFNDTDPDNIEDITPEIIEEADEHQIFYAITDELSGFSISSASKILKIVMEIHYFKTTHNNRRNLWGCGRISYT